MTAYNREKYIAYAIESVLKSSFNNFELIVVDDCSTDRTFEISKSYEIKDSRVRVYQNHKNLGDYMNRNKAADYAVGKYIKYMDSDDVMYSHCLEVMVSAMEKFPNAAYGLSSIGNIKYPFPFSISPKETYLQHFKGFGHFYRAPGSSIINREIFIKNGGFVIPKYAGDTELWFRLSQKYNLVLFPADLYWSRIHENSEGAFESKQKQIVTFRIKMILNFLNHPDCPCKGKTLRILVLRLKYQLFKQQLLIKLKC